VAVERAALSLSLSLTRQGAPGTGPVSCTPAVFFGCCAAYGVAGATYASALTRSRNPWRFKSPMVQPTRAPVDSTRLSCAAS
jgi:hypothetical protein